MDDDKKRIEELEDDLKHRDRRIAELRGEVDELRGLVKGLEENVEDAANVLAGWKETFQMEEVEGGWTWKPFWEERDKIIQDYNKLVQKWNRFVPLINGKQKNIGRPLEASEAQIAQVLKLRKSGTSLRGIAEETNLGLSTVRTIVGKTNGTDRTTKRQLARIDAKQITTTWKRQRRAGDSLPKRAHRVVKDAEALAKEAKGLGRS
jgi:transposase